MFVPTLFGDKHETPRLFPSSVSALAPPPHLRKTKKQAKKASKSVKKTCKNEGTQGGLSGLFFLVSVFFVLRAWGLVFPGLAGGQEALRGIFHAPVWREHEILGPRNFGRTCSSYLFNCFN